MARDYLFSACIPLTMKSRDMAQICRVVAKGNDYVDYYASFEPHLIDGWKLSHMHILLVILVVITCILFCICSLSCYYHYQVSKHNKVPFNVPRFCPECLFPHGHYKRMIRHETMLNELEDQHNRSDMVGISNFMESHDEERKSENDSHHIQ